MRGSVVVLLVLMVAVLPNLIPMSGADRGDSLGPQAASTGSVDWHPIFSGRMRVFPGGMAYDAARDRLLLVAVPYDSLGNGQAPVLLVLDSLGNVVSNTTLGFPPAVAPTVTLDTVLGFGYLTSAGSTIVRVNSTTGVILDNWTYPFDVSAATVSGTFLYASAGGLPIQVIDAQTGVAQGNLVGSPATPFDSLVVDRSGRWLLGSRRPFTALQIDLTNGDVFDLALFNARFTLPLDPARVYVCASNPTPGMMLSFWFANQTLATHRRTSRSCTGPVATNPVTGVVATGNRFLITPFGVHGRTSFGSSDPPVRGLGWTSDGRRLLAVTELPDAFEIGTWDGIPRLLPAPGAAEVHNPHFQSVCGEIRSTSGMNLTDAAVYLDSGSTPERVGLTSSDPCVDLDRVPDGNHTLRVVGWDLLGQPLDATIVFRTDGTNPVLAIETASEVQTAPDALRGWINDSNPSFVRVNGVVAVLVGNRWSLDYDFGIGNNSFIVTAQDRALNGAGPLAGNVRYWPAYTDYVTNATAHFSVPVPPGWTNTTVLLPGGLEAINLIGPEELPLPPIVTVTSLEDPNGASAGHALRLAQASQAFTVSQGGTLLVPAHNLTVANHSAASYTARVLIGSVPERYTETVIVAAEWGRVIVVIVAIPEATWDRHSEVGDWILQGMRIDAAPPVPAGGLPILWIGAGAVGIAAAAAGLALLLWRRRKGPPPPKAVRSEPKADIGQGEGLQLESPPAETDVERRPPP